MPIAVAAEPGAKAASRIKCNAVAEKFDPFGQLSLWSFPSQRLAWPAVE